MPNLKQAKKRVRQATKSRERNKDHMSRYRTFVKNVEKAVVANDKEQATELFKAAASVIDATANKGLIHKNKAARKKSRLNASIRAL